MTYPNAPDIRPWPFNPLSPNTEPNPKWREVSPRILKDMTPERLRFISYESIKSLSQMDIFRICTAETREYVLLRLGVVKKEEAQDAEEAEVRKLIDRPALIKRLQELALDPNSSPRDAASAAKELLSFTLGRARPTAEGSLKQHTNITVDTGINRDSDLSNEEGEY